MKTITLYIARSFIISLIATLLVLTFVMSIGAVFKVMDLLSRGAPWRPIVTIFISGIPMALPLAIPISTLISSLLVFGRLSADGEITAMRSCGLSSWQIMVSPVLISLIMGTLCLYVNNDVMPRGHFVQRSAMTELGMESPLTLLEEGHYIQDFPGYTVYIGKKKDNQLKDIRLYETRKEGLIREVRAKTGIVNVTTNDQGALELLIELKDVKVDPFTDDKPWPAFLGQYSVRIGNLGQRHDYTKKETDLFFNELVASIRDPVKFFPQLKGKDTSVPRMVLAVELNKRIVLSLSCLAFVLLGVPLGIKAHRKESSIGVGISLFLVFNFYLFVIIAESVVDRPEWRPDLIVWVPVLICIELGIYLLKRLN